MLASTLWLRRPVSVPATSTQEEAHADAIRRARPDHAPDVGRDQDEFPTASVFAWKVMHHYSFKPLDRPHVYVLAMHDVDGEWIGGEQLDSPENQIVARYEDALDWSSREEDIAFAYSVSEAREVTDVEGTGTLDSGFEGHPGLLGIFSP